MMASIINLPAMLSYLDNAVLRLIGEFAGRHVLFDKLIKLTHLYTIKTLPLMATLVYLWFRRDQSGRSRCAVTEAIVGMFLSILTSRLIQNLSPSRPRPFHSGNPAFVPPIGTD